MQRQGQVSEPTPFRDHRPQTISIQSSGVPLIAGMHPVIGPYNNEEDEKEEENISSYNRSKLDEEGNEFGDCHNNNDDIDKDEGINAGYDTVVVENLVWEDIDNDLVIPDI